MADLSLATSLTWLHTPSDNAHHISGAPHLFIVENVQFHITGTEVQVQKCEATRKTDK